MVAKNKLIHAARIMHKGFPRYLLLRQLESGTFMWFEEENETGVNGDSLSLALQQARKRWSQHSFRTLGCGFRYTLPERDEHGCNALFHQMISSYSSPNGIYFDEELGNNCFINFASVEARDLWNTLKSEGRL